MEENNTSQKNINQQWAEKVWQNLNNLEEFEKVAKSGIIHLEDFYEYEQGHIPINLVLLRYKSFKLFITTIESLLISVKPFIQEKKFKDICETLETIYKLDHEIIYEKYDARSKITSWVLNETKFSEIVAKMSHLRSLLIENLWPLLSPTAEDTFK